MTLPQKTNHLEAVTSNDQHPCCFAVLGMHDAPLSKPFHDNGPTYLVEWLWDDAILVRGPRSWVCKTSADLEVNMGWARYVR